MAQCNVTVVPAGTSPESGSAVTGETLALSFTVTSQVTGANEPHSAVMVHVPAPSAFMVALVVALSGVTLTIFSLSDFHVTGVVSGSAPSGVKLAVRMRDSPIPSVRLGLLISMPSAFFFMVYVKVEISLSRYPLAAANALTVTLDLLPSKVIGVRYRWLSFVGLVPSVV